MNQKNEKTKLAKRLVGIIFSTVLLIVPILFFLILQRNPRSSGWVPATIAASAATCIVMFAWGFWRLSLFARYSLKSLLIATLALNVCLAMIVAAEDPVVRFCGIVLLFVWIAVVGIGMLHYGIVARFEATEKRVFSELVKSVPVNEKGKGR